ncbi:MAG TPA: PilX N-terminal domain-containing pilus assembly protein [Parasulfuritortus sp.]
MKPRTPISRQSGAVLVISLIFLVLITLIAISGMQGTIMQERIAGNTRDHMLAFQAAETALSQGAASLSASTLPSGTGYYMVPNSSPAATFVSSQDWLSFNWNANSATVATNPVQNGPQAPQFVVERLTTSAPSGGSQIQNIGFGPSQGHGYFRITARGVGSDVNTVVILQEIYVRY